MGSNTYGIFARYKGQIYAASCAVRSNTFGVYASYYSEIVITGITQSGNTTPYTPTVNTALVATAPVSMCYILST